ncbi:MAG: ABC transporter ATP-binding protein [Fidelibacterota bacterium]
MLILSATKLSVSVKTPARKLPLIKDLSFTLRQGETLAVVGENASGKTTLCKTLTGLLPGNFQISGSLKYHPNPTTAIELTDQSESRPIQINGKEIAMVFQDAPGSLNPLMKCGAQLLDVFKEHSASTNLENKQRTLQLLGQLGLPEPATIFNSYPHQLSGGMAQRVALALALAGNPRVLITDEPTTALDTIAKNRYLQLLQTLKKQNSLALIFVTHNLNEALSFADSILILYNGYGLEYGSAPVLREQPRHPFTSDLLDIQKALNQNRLPQPIPGESPSFGQPVGGCPYHPRCSQATERCRTTFPPRLSLANDAFVSCYYPKNN